MLESYSEEYVLGGMSPDIRVGDKARLMRLMKNLKLNFRDVDWKEVKKAFLALPTQIKTLTADATSTHIDKTGHPNEYGSQDWEKAKNNNSEKATSSALDARILWNIGDFKQPYESFSDFINSSSDTIAASGDKELIGTFKELKKIEKVKDVQKRDILDYLMIFMSVPIGDMIENDACWLKQLLRHLIDWIKRLFSRMSVCVRDVTDVISDPDAYYLMLRGKMHEFQKKYPNAKALEYVLFLPDLFRLLVRLQNDERVPDAYKSKISNAIFYLLSPFDFIPDIIPGLGQLDDVVWIGKTIADLINLKYVNPEIIKEHWAGSYETLEQIMQISEKLIDCCDLFNKMYLWMNKTNAATA